MNESRGNPPINIGSNNLIFDRNNRCCNTGGGGGMSIDYESLSVECLTEINRNLSTLCAIVYNLNVSLGILSDNLSSLT